MQNKIFCKLGKGSLAIQLKNANLYAKIGGDKTMEAYKMKVEFNRLFDKLKAEGITQKSLRQMQI